MDDGVSYELGSMWKVSVVEKLSCCCKKKKKNYIDGLRKTSDVAWPRLESWTS